MNDMIQKQASVTDVARQAGVSKATAARVLGGYGTVSAKTRETVEAAAKTLGYRPNELARSMTTGRTGTIGVVVGDIGNPFFSLAVRGISDVVRKADFGVILANSSEDVAEEEAAIRRLLSWRVDGIIVSPASVLEVEHLREVLTVGVPLILLDRDVAELPVDSATTDDEAAAIEVTRLLMARGHRQIAYITSGLPIGGRFSSPASIATGSVRKRVEGFLSVNKAAGILDGDSRVLFGATNYETTLRLVRDLLARNPKPTAIIASDSLIGLEVFKALRELAVRVPTDLSLVTFHDADWTSVTDPPVTVISQPARDMGATAARLLIERMAKADTPVRKLLIPTRLIRRLSD